MKVLYWAELVAENDDEYCLIQKRTEVPFRPIEGDSIHFGDVHFVVDGVHWSDDDQEFTVFLSHADCIETTAWLEHLFDYLIDRGWNSNHSGGKWFRSENNEPTPV